MELIIINEVDGIDVILTIDLFIFLRKHHIRCGPSLFNIDLHLKTYLEENLNK